MARKPPAVPEEPQLNALQLRNRIGRLEECINDLDAFDPTSVEKRYGDPQVIAIEAAINDALVATVGDNTPSYNRYYRAAKLNWAPIVMRTSNPFGRGAPVNHDQQELVEARQHIAEGKQQAITLLRQAVRTVTATADEMDQSVAPSGMPRDNQSGSRKVFVVHGHDDGAREAVARFLERLELEAIILFEQPDQGMTIIEKFEAHAGSVSFAVVLMTPDDLGGSVSSPDHQERARQNVVFELGYFVGKLGRGRAMLLKKGKVEMPSDLAGVIYSELDSSDGWKLKLVRELKAAGFMVDANRAME